MDHRLVSTSRSPGHVYGSAYASLFTTCKTMQRHNRNYCVEGRYECDVNNQYSFFVAPGDFSVGTVGRKEARGSFPTGRFSGISFFLDLSVIANKKTVLQELKINLDTIRSIANTERRYLVLNRNERIDGIFNLLIHVTKEDQISLLRLKAVELLHFLSNQDITKIEDIPVYLNKRRTQLAKSIHKRITDDLTKHITLTQLAEEFQVGTTTLKTSFKCVYGVSIYAYQKTYRLQEARRLLQESEKSIAEIAVLVGYINPGKFTAAFREAYGMTPSEYVNGSLGEGKTFTGN